MVYIVIIELNTEIKQNRILAEPYSNKQEARLTYDLIVKNLNKNEYYNFDNISINTKFIKSVRLLEREIICQR